MKATLLTSMPAHSPEWYEARADGIGSSEIAAVLGISPYTSPFDLYWRKVNREVGEPNPAMAWGTRLEPIIVDAFHAAHPEFIALRQPGIFAHADRPWQRCAPDGLLYDYSPPDDDRGYPVAALECKSDNNRAGWGEPGTDAIPPHYLAQVRWQLDTLGLSSAFVAVTFGGPPVEYVVEHDEADAVLMREAAREFLDRIEAGTPPPVDWHAATTRRLKQLHPEITEEQVEIDDDLAADYLAAVVAARHFEKKRAEAENRLRAAIGDGKWAVTADGRKVATRSVYDVKERVQQVSAHTVNKLTPSLKEKDTAA